MSETLSKPLNGRPCTTCSHPKRNEIEILYAQGSKVSKLAETFDITYPSLLRHLKAHLHLTGTPISSAALKSLEEKAVAQREEILDITSAIRRNRLVIANATLERVEAFRQERADSMKGVPGGGTGLATRTLKSIRVGGVEDGEWKEVEEIAFDHRFVSSVLDTLEYTAKECGGMFEQRALPGQAIGVGSGTTMILVPQTGSTVNIGIASPQEMGLRGILPSQMAGNALEEALLQPEEEASGGDRCDYRNLEAIEVAPAEVEEEELELPAPAATRRGGLWP